MESPSKGRWTTQKYARDYLLQLRMHPLSLRKPENLPNNEIIKEKLYLHQIDNIRSQFIDDSQHNYYPECFHRSFVKADNNSTFLNQRSAPGCVPRGYSFYAPGQKFTSPLSFSKYHSSFSPNYFNQKHSLRTESIYKADISNEDFFENVTDSQTVPWCKEAFPIYPSENAWNFNQKNFEPKSCFPKTENVKSNPKSKKKLSIIDPKTGKNILDGISENTISSPSSISSKENNEDETKTVLSEAAGNATEDMEMTEKLMCLSGVANNYSDAGHVVSDDDLSHSAASSKQSGDEAILPKSQDSSEEEFLKEYSNYRLLSNKNENTLDKVKSGDAAKNLTGCFSKSNGNKRSLYSNFSAEGHEHNAYEFADILNVVGNNGLTSTNSKTPTSEPKSNEVFNNDITAKKRVNKEIDLKEKIIMLRDKIYSMKQDQQKMAIFQSFLRFKKHQLDESFRSLDEKKIDIVNWEYNLYNKSKNLYEKENWLEVRCKNLKKKEKQLEDKEMWLNLKQSEMEKKYKNSLFIESTNLVENSDIDEQLNGEIGSKNQNVDEKIMDSKIYNESTNFKTDITGESSLVLNSKEYSENRKYFPEYIKCWLNEKETIHKKAVTSNDNDIENKEESKHACSENKVNNEIFDKEGKSVINSPLVEKNEKSFESTKYFNGKKEALSMKNKKMKAGFKSQFKKKIIISESRKSEHIKFYLNKRRNVLKKGVVSCKSETLVKNEEMKDELKEKDNLKSKLFEKETTEYNIDPELSNCKLTRKHLSSNENEKKNFSIEQKNIRSSDVCSSTQTSFEKKSDAVKCNTEPKLIDTKSNSGDKKLLESEELLTKDKFVKQTSFKQDRNVRTEDFSPSYKSLLMSKSNSSEGRKYFSEKVKYYLNERGDINVKEDDIEQQRIRADDLSSFQDIAFNKKVRISEGRKYLPENIKYYLNEQETILKKKSTSHSEEVLSESKEIRNQIKIENPSKRNSSDKVDEYRKNDNYVLSKNDSKERISSVREGKQHRKREDDSSLDSLFSKKISTSEGCKYFSEQIKYNLNKKRGETDKDGSSDNVDSINKNGEIERKLNNVHQKSLNSKNPHQKHIVDEEQKKMISEDFSPNYDSSFHKKTSDSDGRKYFPENTKHDLNEKCNKINQNTSCKSAVASNKRVSEEFINIKLLQKQILDEISESKDQACDCSKKDKKILSSKEQKIEDEKEIISMEPQRIRSEDFSPSHSPSFKQSFNTSEGRKYFAEHTKYYFNEKRALPETENTSFCPEVLSEKGTKTELNDVNYPESNIYEEGNVCEDQGPQKYKKSQISEEHLLKDTSGKRIVSKAQQNTKTDSTHNKEITASERRKYFSEYIKYRLSDQKCTFEKDNESCQVREPIECRGKKENFTEKQLFDNEVAKYKENQDFNNYKLDKKIPDLQIEENLSDDTHESQKAFVEQKKKKS